MRPGILNQSLNQTATRAPYFRVKGAILRLSLPRLALIASMCIAGLGAAQGAGPSAHIPVHPPAPPVRPDFPGDDAFRAEAAAAEAARPQDAAEAARSERASVEAAVPEPRPAELQAAPQPAAEAVAAPPPEPPYKPGEENIKGFDLAEQAGLANLVRKYAHRHNVPVALIHRVIMRESRYQPHLVHRTFFGLMQIAPAMARGMGYHGSPKGLLDAETNLAYATPYLANAWRLSGGDADTAVRLYASGYYNTAKRRHMLAEMRTADSPPLAIETSGIDPMAAPPPPPRPQNPFEAIFGGSGN